MNVGVDEAGDKKSSFARDNSCSRGGLGARIPLNARNASVLNQHAAPGEVSEIFW